MALFTMTYKDTQSPVRTRLNSAWSLRFAQTPAIRRSRIAQLSSIPLRSLPSSPNICLNQSFARSAKLHLLTNTTTITPQSRQRPLRKQCFALVLLTLPLLGFSQEQTTQPVQPDTRIGTIRFSPYDFLSGFEKGVIAVEANWTQYVSKNIGIPVQLNLRFWNLTGVGVLAGYRICNAG
jgi:hypothetical protein